MSGEGGAQYIKKGVHIKSINAALDAIFGLSSYTKSPIKGFDPCQDLFWLHSPFPLHILSYLYLFIGSLFAQNSQVLYF